MDHGLPPEAVGQVSGKELRCAAADEEHAERGSAGPCRAAALDDEDGEEARERSAASVRHDHGKLDQSKTGRKRRAALPAVGHLL
jgi:hypothetical protein